MWRAFESNLFTSQCIIIQNNKTKPNVFGTMQYAKKMSWRPVPLSLQVSL